MTVGSQTRRLPRVGWVRERMEVRGGTALRLEAANEPLGVIKS